jgi:hypothetical protein
LTAHLFQLFFRSPNIPFQQNFGPRKLRKTSIGPVLAS